jgi:hypothetical protein
MAEYVTTGYVTAGYYQTGLSVDWLNKVIFVPRFFLTFNGGTSYTLDTNLFRLALRDLEDNEEGMAHVHTHNHNTTVVLAGVTYARVIEIINGYSVTFEDGQYSVNLIGSNSNIGDVTSLNQVSVRVNNSAGLQQVTSGSGVTAGDKADIISGVFAQAMTTPIESNMKQVNTHSIDGAGTAYDPWGPV